jgi:hypothetical protein
VPGDWLPVRGGWLPARGDWLPVRGGWLPVRGGWLLRPEFGFDGKAGFKRIQQRQLQLMG